MQSIAPTPEVQKLSWDLVMQRNCRLTDSHTHA